MTRKEYDKILAVHHGGAFEGDEPNFYEDFSISPEFRESDQTAIVEVHRKNRGLSALTCKTAGEFAIALQASHDLVGAFEKLEKDKTRMRVRGILRGDPYSKLVALAREVSYEIDFDSHPSVPTKNAKKAEALLDEVWQYEKKFE